MGRLLGREPRAQAPNKDKWRGYGAQGAPFTLHVSCGYECDLVLETTCHNMARPLGGHWFWWPLVENFMSRLDVLLLWIKCAFRYPSGLYVTYLRTMRLTHVDLFMVWLGQERNLMLYHTRVLICIL